MTEARLEKLALRTVGDLAALPQETLEAHFGRYGVRLYELARGLDTNPVVADRKVKSISAEDTLARDIPLAETEDVIRRLAEKVWHAARREPRQPRTVVLKLKTAGFEVLTRSLSAPTPPGSAEELAATALALRDRVALPPTQLYRLVGVGLSNFREATEPALFVGTSEGVDDAEISLDP